MREPNVPIELDEESEVNVALSLLTCETSGMGGGGPLCHDAVVDALETVTDFCRGAPEVGKFVVLFSPFFDDFPLLESVVSGAAGAECD